jgi:hypothetical protein
MMEPYPFEKKWKKDEETKWLRHVEGISFRQIRGLPDDSILLHETLES